MPVALRVPLRAVARFEGTPEPGQTITLSAAGSTGETPRIHWLQIRGPAVRLDHPTEKEARFTVPDAEGPLGFVLAVADAQGLDTTELSIPVGSTGQSRGAQSPRADAGDDQLGLVGRQVTLNGIGSEPRGKIGYRWVQTGGPTVRLKIEDGYIFSFVPTVPGVYRFALVVSSGLSISEPDEVCVTVGAGTRGTIAGAGSLGTSSTAQQVPTQEVARTGLAALRLGPKVTEPLARAFEDTADRLDLYQTYADAFSEMSRRLELNLPEDPTQRNLWVERLFHPLTARVIEVMLPEGLDLRRPEGQSFTLSEGQKAVLAEQFRLMAEGLRSAKDSR